MLSKLVTYRIGLNIPTDINYGLATGLPSSILRYTYMYENKLISEVKFSIKLNVQSN